MTQDNDEKLENKNNGFRKLINCGAEIAGGAIGSALGFLAGGPAGAAALGAGGSLAAMALKHIGQEASERLLGPREKVRVGGVLAITASAINNRIENGEKIRSDGFFEERTQSGRSNVSDSQSTLIVQWEAYTVFCNHTRLTFATSSSNSGVSWLGNNFL